MKGQKEAVHLLAEIKEIQMKYRRQQQEKRRRSRERRKAAGLPATTSDEDTSDEEIIMPVSLKITSVEIFCVKNLKFSRYFFEHFVCFEK
jgi:hypothetical protein